MFNNEDQYFIGMYNFRDINHRNNTSWGNILLKKDMGRSKLGNSNQFLIISFILLII